jgi:aspartyl-tRNA(Asn)/glutamyl-tRNA(Gln) amidotransferase subunit C
MALSRQQVEQVSRLARLELSPKELDMMTAQLAQIVDYVEQLGELDTELVEPMAHAVELCNVFRADQPQPSLPRDEALANAPKHDGECYRVPAVLGE